MKPKRGTPWAIAIACLTTLSPAFSQVVDSFYPPFGAPGEPIRLTGSGFAGTPLVVRFGGPNGPQDTTARATSDTIIFATVPNGAVTGPVYVKVGNAGASSRDDFLVLGRGPFLLSFFPQYGSVNEDIVIQGWHLTNATSVKFGGKASVNFMPNADGSRITARVPSGATNGPISVTTTYGTSNTVDSFTVIGAGPYIASFSPPAGMDGTPVTLDGAHFSAVTNVSFNGKPGVNLFVASDTSIQVKAPAGVTTGRISVAAPTGKYTNDLLFFAPPVITGFSPATGRAGTNILITGSNLLGMDLVLVGGVQAAILTNTGNDKLVVRAPTNASSGPIRVYLPVAFSFTTTSNFTFQPLITAFTPTAGPTGTVVTITGASLDEGLSAVKFGGIAGVSNVVVDSRTVRTQVPNTATNAFISVTTSNGTYTISNYFYLPPVLTSSSPSNSAPGTTVTLAGQNFIGTSNVMFNGLAAAFVAPTNNTSLFARVPTNVTTGPIAVTTPGGTATNGIFYGAPVITGFNPASGLPGQQVTITGTNFQRASAVAFGGVAAATFAIATNGGSITANVPAAAKTGPISVTAPAGTATSAQPFVLDLLSDVAVSLTVSPGAAFPNSNAVYIAVVTNAGPLEAPAVVFKDTLPAGLTLRSNQTTRGTITVKGSEVTGSIGTLAVSNSATIRLFVTPNSLGTFLNTVTVSSDYDDPDPSNNSASAALASLPLPLLSIRPYSPSQYMISWPVMLTNWALQYRSNLVAGQAWSYLPTAPIVSGTNQFVVESAGDQSRYYRLKSP